jgi:heterodisulfide reductase subunit B
MRLPYFPGCTLYSKAKNYDESARVAAAALDIQMDEMKDWQCCGALYSQVTDNLMGLVASARILSDARQGSDKLVTLCSFCYNTLKRVNHVIQNDGEKRVKLNTFLEQEYDGRLKVVHLLEVLRDDLGFDKVAKQVKKPLTGLRVAPYYGCLLLRPAKEIGLDNPEEPTILEGLLTSLGAEVVDFPQKTECCGSYLIVSNPDLAAEASSAVLRGAARREADVLVTTCPLCQYNLDQRAAALEAGNGAFGTMPILYFSQLLGLALGVEPARLGLDRHIVDPRPLLERVFAPVGVR